MKMTYLRDVVTLRLDVGKCVGCGRCAEVCPHGVFVMDGGKSRIVDRDACMECGACARNCPADALWVKNGVGCAVGILNSAMGRKAACCGEDQACCCGGDEEQGAEKDQSEGGRMDEKGTETMKEQAAEKEQATGSACGPGCDCGASGVGSRAKWIVCGVVALAAVVTVAARAMRQAEADGAAKPAEYAVPGASVAGDGAAQPVAVPVTDAWATPLKAMAELNVVAADTDGVFLVIPSDDAERVAAIQKEVSAAAATITARGSRMGKFMLSQEAKEYANLARQVGTPAVLAMCKGRGMAGVPGEQVSQDSLLKAFVGASRPSGCGPSGCGPGATGCGTPASQPDVQK